MGLPTCMFVSTSAISACNRMTEVSRFFQDYKVLENKIVEIDHFLDRDDALDVIREAIELYAKLRDTLRNA